MLGAAGRSGAGRDWPVLRITRGFNAVKDLASTCGQASGRFLQPSCSQLISDGSVVQLPRILSRLGCCFSSTTKGPPKKTPDPAQDTHASKACKNRGRLRQRIAAFERALRPIYGGNRAYVSKLFLGNAFETLPSAVAEMQKRSSSDDAYTSPEAFLSLIHRHRRKLFFKAAALPPLDSHETQRRSVVKALSTLQPRDRASQRQKMRHKDIEAWMSLSGCGGKSSAKVENKEQLSAVFEKACADFIIRPVVAELKTLYSVSDAIRRVTLLDEETPDRRRIIRQVWYALLIGNQQMLLQSIAQDNAGVKRLLRLLAHMVDYGVYAKRALKTLCHTAETSRILTQAMSEKDFYYCLVKTQLLMTHLLPIIVRQAKETASTDLSPAFYLLRLEYFVATALLHPTGTMRGAVLQLRALSEDDEDDIKIRERRAGFGFKSYPAPAFLTFATLQILTKPLHRYLALGVLDSEAKTWLAALYARLGFQHNTFFKTVEGELLVQLKAEVFLAAQKSPVLDKKDILHRLAGFIPALNPPQRLALNQEPSEQVHPAGHPQNLGRTTRKQNLFFKELVNNAPGNVTRLSSVFLTPTERRLKQRLQQRAWSLYQAVVVKRDTKNAANLSRLESAELNWRKMSAYSIPNLVVIWDAAKEVGLPIRRHRSGLQVDASAQPPFSTPLYSSLLIIAAKYLLQLPERNIDLNRTQTLAFSRLLPRISQSASNALAAADLEKMMIIICKRFLKHCPVDQKVEEYHALMLDEIARWVSSEHPVPVGGFGGCHVPLDSASWVRVYVAHKSDMPHWLTRPQLLHPFQKESVGQIYHEDANAVKNASFLEAYTVYVTARLFGCNPRLFAQLMSALVKLHCHENKKLRGVFIAYLQKNYALLSEEDIRMLLRPVQACNVSRTLQLQLSKCYQELTRLKIRQSWNNSIFHATKEGEPLKEQHLDSSGRLAEVYQRLG